MNASDNMRGALLMVVSMFAFTAGDAVVKLITQSVPLTQTMFLRGALTTVGLLLIARMSGTLNWQVPPRDRPLLAWRSVAEVSCSILFFIALMRMPLANATAIMQTLPLMVTLAGFVFLGEPVGWRRILAIILGFVGMLMVIQPGGSDFNLWSLLAVMSMLLVVLRDLVTRRMSSAMPTIMIAVFTSATVTLVSLAGSAFEDWGPVTGSAVMLIPLAASTLLVGYLSIVATMRVGELGFVAPFRYTALFWALLLGWWLFDTLPNRLALAGGGLVTLTGIYTLWRERKRR